ncbi:type IV toxin-antitoxin system AbiEi family antitoxin [Rhodanobacter sp. FW106-PBR-R2A-1-13]|uniref:type IV toxin-antitoxin system AbiEi family antitoxin n=1 Tax=Rhodanobacter sp. FW106-PBR-R2A-1-13 TaxID=3454845 RepID=UPI0034E5E94A
MDKTTRQLGDTILLAAMQAAQRHGLEVRLVAAETAKGGGRRVDAVMDIHYGKHKVRYGVETKRGLRPGTLGAIVHQLRHLGPNTMLVTDYVTPNLADELRNREVHFMDAAGNAYLATPDFMVWVKGERPRVAPEAPVGTGRAFTATGLQVLFALLCAPERAALPYRDIAKLAGVAHGTVGWVMVELPRLGFLATVPQHGRRLVNVETLLAQWTEAYARTLRPKMVLGRYRAETLEWATADNALRYDLALGGEPAAAQLTQRLRPGTATFYGNRVEPRLLAYTDEFDQSNQFVVIRAPAS